ncbi:MAG TPA: pyridoxamine 5'-phosphate oxidase family protein [Gammaproteobacteria bacterium]|nr:pyridoxamine 5'-phosphate oxidase family protein [Gammaproteobacteria bacterium]
MSTDTPDFDLTSRNRLMRYPTRGHYDKATIYPILDEALICHVGFSIDGQPYVIPTIHARMGDELLLHGLKGGRLLEHIGAGNPICVAVTLLDGLVLARTAFNHSMNYRSVVLYGRGAAIEEPAAKLAALERLTEQVAPGRWRDVRPPNDKELKATTIVGIDIESATAKIRQGPPGDDGEDLAFPVWAGVVPTPIVPQPPQTDPKQTTAYPLPAYVNPYVRPRGRA